MLTDALAAHAVENGELTPTGAEDDAYFAELRAREFARLDAAGEAYLDYTGGALYAASQVRAHAELLCGGVYGNPHSDSPASRASTAFLEEARAHTLRFFGADPAEYEVCFTANATGAVRLVAEAYPFGPRSTLLLAADNHNSVNGIREYARRAGARVRYVPLDAELRLRDAEDHLRTAWSGGACLFAYPAQSNFSGVRHPLALVRQARALGYDVLLDAAALVPTSPLSLREAAPDFVPVSFYKMFGYPTGLGALLARREALARLRRPWFAGGTVELASVQSRLHLLKAGAEGFEDGTPNFLAAAALPAGFALLEAAGWARLGRRLAALTAELLARLGALTHSNGCPVVELYGPTDTTGRGATVAFNVLDAAGRYVDYELVEAFARASRVSVRGGCFCNPGAGEHALRLPPDEMARCISSARAGGHGKGRFRACLAERGRPAGAVRISLGLPTNVTDVLRGVGVAAAWRDCWVD